MSYSTLAEVLWALGYRQTIAVKTLNPNTYVIGSINPSVPYDGSDSAFSARYGLSLRETKGNLVGERFSPDILADLKNHETNPLNLSSSFNPYDLVANADAKYIKGWSNNAVWDSYILPLHAELFPVVVPPPPPPPPPPVDPVDPIDPPHVCPILPSLSGPSKRTAQVAYTWNFITNNRRLRLENLKNELEDIFG